MFWLVGFASLDWVFCQIVLRFPNLDAYTLLHSVSFENESGTPLRLRISKDTGAEVDSPPHTPGELSSLINLPHDLPWPRCSIWHTNVFSYPLTAPTVIPRQWARGCQKGTRRHRGTKETAPSPPFHSTAPLSAWAGEALPRHQRGRRCSGAVQQAEGSASTSAAPQRARWEGAQELLPNATAVSTRLEKPQRPPTPGDAPAGASRL